MQSSEQKCLVDMNELNYRKNLSMAALDSWIKLNGETWDQTRKLYESPVDSTHLPAVVFQLVCPDGNLGNSTVRFGYITLEQLSSIPKTTEDGKQCDVRIMEKDEEFPPIVLKQETINDAKKMLMEDRPAIGSVVIVLTPIDHDGIQGTVTGVVFHSGNKVPPK